MKVLSNIRKLFLQLFNPGYYVQSLFLQQEIALAIENIDGIIFYLEEGFDSDNLAILINSLLCLETFLKISLKKSGKSRLIRESCVDGGVYVLVFFEQWLEILKSQIDTNNPGNIESLKVRNTLINILKILKNSLQDI